MFLIISISSNLLQTSSSFFTSNSKCYVTNKWKKFATSEISQSDVIEKYYYIRKKNLTETTAAIIIEKVQKDQNL